MGKACKALKSLYTLSGVIDTEFSSFDDTTVVGIEKTEIEVQSQNALTIYSNPVSNRIEIIFNTQDRVNSDAKVSVMNSQMIKILEFDTQITGNRLLIEDLADLPSGIYYIYIVVGQKAFATKFIKS